MTTFYRALILIAFVLAAPSAFAADLPADMMLSAPDGWEARHPAVPFSHTLHDRLDPGQCATCHHEWDGSGQPASCSSSGCHDQQGRREARSFYRAFHDRSDQRSCVGCHSTARRAGSTDIPVSCGDCHVRN